MIELAWLGWFGYASAIGISAIGSALGIRAAGQGAIGGWKKCYAEGKKPPFMIIAFTGMPLSQTLYGLVLMLIIQGHVNTILAAAANGTLGASKGIEAMAAMGAIGFLGSIGMAVSAWAQGVACSSAIDSLVATGKGTGNYVLVAGIIETVALFVLAFMIMALGIFA